ncbi:MAG: DsbA family protein [Cyanobacteria bacterium P01_A01_bin.17]
MPLQETMPTIRDVDHTRGSLSAALLMMTYGDYQCPQCGQAHQAVERLRHVLGNQLCFIFRHFPRPDIHSQSQKAAAIAEAAGSQGKFWEMHDKLFANQQALDDASLVAYADELGLDISQFLQEIGGHAHHSQIQANVESAQQQGVQETPTVFISIRQKGKVNIEPFIQQFLDIIDQSGGCTAVVGASAIEPEPS